MQDILFCRHFGSCSIQITQNRVGIRHLVNFGKHDFGELAVWIQLTNMRRQDICVLIAKFIQDRGPKTRKLKTLTSKVSKPTGLRGKQPLGEPLPSLRGPTSDRLWYFRQGGSYVKLRDVIFFLDQLIHEK